MHVLAALAAPTRLILGGYVLPLQPSQHALALFARIDAGEFNRPDGSLMAPHEIAARAGSRTAIVRYWIRAFRPDLYARQLDERTYGVARRLRAVLREPPATPID